MKANILDSGKAKKDCLRKTSNITERRKKENEKNTQKRSSRYSGDNAICKRYEHINRYRFCLLGKSYANDIVHKYRFDFPHTL